MGEERITRIFVSSANCLLLDTRQKVIWAILNRGQFPIAQEFNFFGKSKDYSIDVVMKKIDSADALILIIGHYYGSIIGAANKCDTCLVKELCDYFTNGQDCKLSYTHYEYLYAKYKKIPIRTLCKKDWDDDEAAVSERKSCFEKYSASRGCVNCKEKIKSTDEIKRTYDAWVKSVYIRFTYLFNSQEDLDSPTTNMIDSILEELGDERSTAGLFPFAEYRKMKEGNDLYAAVRDNCIERYYANQSEVLSNVAERFRDGSLYLKDDNGKPLIRVLCFRGSSFVNGSNHEWEEFIFSEETKKQSIEFLLADLDDEAILSRRHKAFPRNESYEQFKKKYQSKMKAIKEQLLCEDDDYCCQLYIHREATLPFRMIFIGSVLFLSFFLNEKPAINSPVYEVNEKSQLYKACEEYYNRVKENAIFAVKQSENGGKLND
ncbi:MAG: DUF4062 domain-containing protein [Clostridiales bacterium]|jgi:hypothetical protein|nr:DUF4062 domain-containing protein [Clostridiales bacterium]